MAQQKPDTFISLEPNWPVLKDWFLRIKAGDLAQYRRMVAADESGSVARWLGEPWPLPSLKAMRRSQAAGAAESLRCMPGAIHTLWPHRIPGARR